MADSEQITGEIEDDPKKTTPLEDVPVVVQKEDALLEALSWLTKFYGTAFSSETLLAGLPLDEETFLTPEMFIQAAHKNGYQADLVERSLSELHEEILPAVLVLNQGASCIVTSLGNGQSYDVYWPVEKRHSQETRAFLNQEYTGHVLYIKAKTQTEKTVESELGPDDKHWFWQTVHDNKWIYGRVALTALFINFFALVSPLFIMTVYDRVLPNQSYETGWVLAIGAFFVFSFDFIMRLLRSYFIDVAGRRSDVILGQKIYDHVLDMQLNHKRSSSGAFANNLREFDALRDFFTSATLTAIVDFPFSFFFMAIIWVIAGKVAFILLVLYFLVMAVCMYLQIPVQKLIVKSMRSAEAKHGLLVESINALETIKTVGGEGKLRARYADYIGESALWGQKARFLSGIGGHFSTFIQQITSIIIILTGMYLVGDGDLSVGALIASVILGGRAMAPVGQLAGLISKYHHAKSALTTLNNIMHLPLERGVHQNFLYRPNLHGNYHFKGASFTYAGQPEPCLKDIDLIIKPGEKVGIVGRVGSGKSTLIKLMVRLYMPDEGVVRIDGTDMRQIDPVDIRRNTAYVGQDAVLLGGSIRENITLGYPKATDEEVLAAAQMAGVHDFIRKHPHGYDARIGERGEGLSGGQKQAVLLARAFVQDKPILICDEPTNAMDSLSEQILLKKLLPYVQDKTFVLVSHRQSLLKLVDRLILIEGGEVIADGPRQEILQALSNGQFAARLD